ncbi:TonB-dependent receptor domain-containing protein [Thermomonas sp.]|uniref:TonB-dependent receptor n=1 Tax=Thermomonas sp. TaxID=1971895 RepID=UPI002EFA0B1A
MASNYLAKGLKRSALTVALGLCFAGGVQAQSTTGGISGSVPAGSTVTISNNSGLTRTLTADANGRYNASNLPVGSYTVVSGDNKREVVVTVGSNTNVSFGGGDATTLGTVTVTGATIASIDTAAVDTRSVLTAQQLERLPLARSAEAIALLAPGAVSGAAGFFGGLVSFGGSGVSENAYYVNGYFTGEPLSNLGGFSLPYGAIEQQETFIGGYSAKYGRSDGGVINQIGKRGTNEWHFGGQVTYTPKNMRGSATDLYLPNMDFSQYNEGLPATCGDNGDEQCEYKYEDATKAGKLYSRGKESNAWSHSYSAYVGGPIIQDRLFFYGAGEWTTNESSSAPNVLATPRLTRSTTKVPKFYGKLDWTITDNHFLELTYLQQKTETSGSFYDYDFNAATTGALQTASAPDSSWQKNQYAILKYTGYLTDSLTLSATYGQGKLQVLNQPFLIGDMPLLSNQTLQNPALNGGTPIRNPIAGYQGRDAQDDTRGLRADLEWVLGDHTLTFGIDNIKFEAKNEGVTQFVDRWIYGRSSASNIVSGHVGSAVSPTNPNGYYAYKYYLNTATSMTLDQKAWYIEDRWQVTDNLLLSLGIRNDQFANANNVGEKYLDAKNQWAPRLGFAWDVNGDSSMKIFGNAGRYYLAMPNNVAIRGASASTFTREYFTYTGIDANGVPTGLTPIPRVDGGSGPYSANGEYGQPIDVLSFAPKDLKNMYQDEFILGMETMLTDKWMIGAKLTHRSLKSAMDDICDPARMAAKLETIEAGLSDKVEIPGCFMFNPGGTNTFSLADIDEDGNRTGTRTEVVMTAADWGFTDKMKRTYSGLDIYLERPFDGKWEARIDYTYSKSKGNMEGQVKSEFGQDNISKTQDWDAAEIMAYAYGYLANDRRHQLKIRGSYAITDEWMIAGNYRINSGSPFSCLGYFNPGGYDENSGASDPIGYGASYHTCFGQIATPGSVRNPWNRTLDLGLSYTPAFLDKKLTLGVQVRNVFNENAVLQSNVTSESSPYTVSNTFMLPQGRQTPRTVVFTASYDW